MEDLEFLSLGNVLERGAAQVLDKIAVVDGEQRKTYTELNTMADALAAGLSEIGFKKGDRAAIYMKNSIELVTAFYALQKIGVIAVWVNPLYRESEAEFILKNSEAKGVFIFRQWGNQHYLDDIMRLKNNLPQLEYVILAENGEVHGVHSLDDLIKRGSPASLPTVEIDPQEDLAMLLYTSGTTGKPKGAMITHYAAVRAGWEYSLGVQATAEDIFIGFLP